ncbi:MAG: winged helix-turn-helix domain-containing protein [Candidatus Thermoplasmatota archaeon]|nr:winged helix-turn-helix domain-containing protein [Candidatus Thermoplasmatota archaeon]
MFRNSDSLSRSLWWVFVGTKGGITRLKIVKKLMDNPTNIYGISQSLNLNYRTVEHHIRFMEKNDLIVSEGDKYGRVYFPSPLLISNYEKFNEMLKRAGLN